MGVGLRAFLTELNIGSMKPHSKLAPDVLLYSGRSVFRYTSPTNLLSP